MDALAIDSLLDFARLVRGGVVQTDRGNGSAGPLWLGEVGDNPYNADDWDGLHAWLVTEPEDPDAWRLAREAFAALELEGEPEYVAVGYPKEDYSVGNPHQCVWAG